MIQVKELVITDLSRRGTGKDETSPVRSVLEVYSKDGELLATHDSQGNYSVEDLIAFGKFCMSLNDSPIEEIFKKWRS